MSQPTIFKEDNEIITIGWDYSPEIITDAIITINPSGLEKNGDKSIDKNIVTQQVKDGLPGENYRVIFKVTTDEDNVYVDKLFVSIFST